MTDVYDRPRSGDWMQTFTGRQFWPLDPRPEDVDPLDVAHALGYLCRYGGHTRRFYSVAEHCILMSLVMPTRELALAALLHDAAEAYVVDVPRPLKRHLAGYAAIEDGVLSAVLARFDVTFERAPLALGGHLVLPRQVKAADDRILVDEREQLLAPPPAPWFIDGYEPPTIDGPRRVPALEPLGVGIDALPPHRAAEAYLARLESLGVTL